MFYTTYYERNNNICILSFMPKTKNNQDLILGLPKQLVVNLGNQLQVINKDQIHI